MSTVGDKLGRYELITRIGQGGMAEVQLAIQRGPGGFEKLVVVKLVHENLATQKTFVDMLLDEARMAALVKHPNVVDIYDLGEDGGRYFIAMEYLEGEPLLAVLRAGREGKRLDVMSTARLIADTAEGLEAAHQLRSMSGELIELVHHDVSLGNIVVLYDGQVKLVDFGVAKASQQTSGPGAGKVQGKFSYMAPEKLRGSPGDRRSDIWSLGCVLWEALTLRRLFKGGNDGDTMKQVLEAVIPKPSEVNADVPEELDPIVMKALERDPDQRFATASQMADALEEILGKHGYARKNAVIARYMQDVFADHIAARKRLLQEVSSKGRASPAILEAAFDEPLATGSPVDADAQFSIKFKRPISELTALGDPTPLPAPVPPDPEPPEVRVWAEAEPAVSTPRTKAVTSSPVLARRETSLPPAPESRRSPMLIIVIGAVVIAGIVIAAILMTKHDEPAKPPTPAVVETSVPPAPTRALPMPSNAVAIDAAVEAPPIEAPPPPRGNPEPLFKSGLRTLFKGDAKAALALFEKARDADPDYAPTYRGLGLAHEKLGDNGAARTAFARYLELAPNAEDAPAIKKRLQALP